MAVLQRIAELPYTVILPHPKHNVQDTHVTFLQAFAGIVTVSVGHCHPKVVSAVQQQSALLQHTTTIYLNNQIAEYAKELTDRLPGNLKVPCSTLLKSYAT